MKLPVQLYPTTKENDETAGPKYAAISDGSSSFLGYLMVFKINLNWLSKLWIVNLFIWGAALAAGRMWWLNTATYHVYNEFYEIVNCIKEELVKETTKQVIIYCCLWTK